MRKTDLAALALLCLLIALIPALALGEVEEPQYFLRISERDDIRIGTRLDPQVYRLNSDGTATAVYWSDGVREWTTSDPSVIDFREYHIDEFEAVGYGRATISVTAPDGTVLSREFHVMEPPKTLMISHKSVTLREGETFQLSYDYEGGDGSYGWYCSGDSATVNQDGLVTARGYGKATVVVWSAADDSIRDTCAVTVLEDNNSIEIHPALVYLAKGESQQFTVTTRAGTPVTATFYKEYASNGNISLTKDGLATAESDANGSNIYAIDAMGRKVTATIHCVTKPETLALAYSCSEMAPNGFGNIMINNSFPIYGMYTFTSTDPSVIYFDDVQRSEFACKKPGKATVTVTGNYTGGQASITLTVKPVNGIYLNSDFERVFWGTSFKLVAYDRNTRKPVSCTYTSSIPQIASVGKTSGVVTARGIYYDPEEGYTYDRVTIYVKDSRGRRAEAIIEVIYPPTSLSLSVDEGDPMMRVGDTLTLKADVDVPGLSVVYGFDGQFTSSNPSVAKVDKSGKVTAVGVGTAVITASMYNGVSDSLSVTVGAADPEWVRITCGDLVLGRGEQLAMDRYPPEFNQGASSAYAYYSSDRSVLSAGGRWIQAVGVGTATLTIRTFNDVRDSVTVTVKNAPTQINVSSEHIRLAVGDQEDLTISLPDGEAGAFRVTAEGDNCVSFSEVSDDTVRVTGKKTGSLTLKFATYNGVTKTVIISVIPGPSSVSLPKTLRLGVGDAYTFVPKFKGNPTGFKFTSKTPAVATITEDGVVTPVAPGKTIITVETGNGKKASCELIVYQKVTSIDLSQNRAALSPGMKLRLIPTVLPATASNKAVTWTSSNRAVMTVDKKGVVTVSRSAAPGTNATITATAADGSGTTGTLEIIVLPSAQRIVLKQGDAELGDSLTVDYDRTKELALTASVTPVDAVPDVTWSSSDRKIATVDSSGSVKLKKLGTVTITATAKDASGVKKSLRLRITRLADAIVVSGPDGLIPGASAQLSAAVTPAAASNKAVVWTSSDPAVMKVDKKGVVTVSKTATPGATATITATAADGSGVTASRLVCVTQPVTAIVVTAETGNAHVNYKGYLQLGAAVSPATAFGGVTWKSSNRSYVTVDANGRIYGKKVGRATVYAVAKDGSGVRGSIMIRVIAPVTGVRLLESTKVFIDRTKKLTATLSPSMPTFKTLTWQSDNEAVATVAADGTVTAKGLGTAVITATAYNGLNDSCTVTVAQPVERISLIPENGFAVAYKGEKVRLLADIAPGNANDRSLTWKSSNTKYATVDAQGYVTGKRPGRVKITATAKDGSGTAGSIYLTIASPEKSIKLRRTSAVLYHNTGTDALRQIKLTPSASKGTVYRGLIWSVVSGDVVTVDAVTGVVTAVKEGTAVIRATTDRGHSADCTVTVRTLPTALTLKTTEKTLAFKQSYNMGADVLMDGTEPALTWTTSNKKVATVSSTGVVKASKDKTGKVVITAISKDGLRTTCTITVVKSLTKGLEADSTATEPTPESEPMIPPEPTPCPNTAGDPEPVPSDEPAPSTEPATTPESALSTEPGSFAGPAPSGEPEPFSEPERAPSPEPDTETSPAST